MILKKEDNIYYLNNYIPQSIYKIPNKYLSKEYIYNLILVDTNILVELDQKLNQLDILI